MKAYILAINSGSSSIKFALYESTHPLKRRLFGNVDRIGLSGTNLTFTAPTTNHCEHFGIKAPNHKKAAAFLIGWLKNQIDFALVKAVGHRVVHGLKHTQSQFVTSKLLKELRHISSYDLEHLPGEIELIEAFRRMCPQIPQVACFDTAFHQTMPRLARLLPIPRRFDERGVQRYGFHGLSYAYLMAELTRVAGRKEAQGRIILAHLGNGVSLAAVLKGRSIDTSMGFTPAAGLVMGTRPGDLDPGVAWYLMTAEKLNPAQFNRLINHESGLLGVSQTSSDMRDLIARQKKDVRAAEAVALFCYQAKKWIGSFAAVLGGLDTLVFSGGIGENSPLIRAGICQGLEFLGIKLDETQNNKNTPVISKKGSRVTVRVIHTDEESQIVRLVLNLLKN